MAKTPAKPAKPGDWPFGGPYFCKFCKWGFPTAQKMLLHRNRCTKRQKE